MLLIRLSRRTQTLGKTDPLAVDLTLLINAATVLGLRSGTDLIDKLLFILWSKLILPRKAAYLFYDMVLKLYDAFVILNHTYVNSFNSALPSSITMYEGLLPSLGIDGEPGFMNLIPFSI